MMIDEYTVLLRSAGTRTLFELAQIIEAREAGYRVAPDQLIEVRRAMTRISRVLHDLQIEPVPVAVAPHPRTQRARSSAQRFQIR